MDRDLNLRYRQVLEKVLKTSLYPADEGEYITRACSRLTAPVLIRLEEPEVEILKERIDDVLESFIY
jgi:hypothetical protein